MEEKNKVTVTIGRKEYTIIAEESTDYILSVTSELNGRISQVSDTNSGLGPEKSMILAALNLCDDYLKMRQTNTALQRQVMKCTKEMEKLQRITEQTVTRSEEADELRKQIVYYSDELRKAELELKRLRADAEKHEELSEQDAENKEKTENQEDAKEKGKDGKIEENHPSQNNVSAVSEKPQDKPDTEKEAIENMKRQYEKQIKDLEEKHRLEVQAMRAKAEQREKEILDMIDEL